MGLNCIFFFFGRDEGEDNKENSESIPPHCRITIKNTKEIAGFNGLSDALKRLDFR